MPRAADQAYRLLRERILQGSLAPGDHLGESELAASLAVSRTPVRDALRRLQVEGLVQQEPNRGARVSDWSEDVAELYELRMLLEGHAARRAATRLQSQQVDRLEELCGLMEQAAQDEAGPHVDRIAELNSEFHRIILSAASSSRLSALTSTVVELPLVLRTFQRYARKDLQRSFAHHRELVDGFRARDAAWAESVMRSHISAARAVLVAVAVEGRGTPASPVGSSAAPGVG